jgi:hypothetical protein
MLDNNIVERLLESIDTSETRYVMHEMYSKDKSISFFCLFKPIDFVTTILFFSSRSWRNRSGCYGACRTAGTSHRLLPHRQQSTGHSL